MNNQEIRQKLLELADEKYKNFHGGLCPGTNDILGVRVPILRNFAKEIIKNENWREYLDHALDDYYEERMLQGMVIGLGKMELEEFLQRVEDFVPKIDNWAVCDVCVAGFKITKKYPKEIWNFLQKYFKSTKEYELRFAIVMLLDFYITEEYINDVLKIIAKINNSGYYVKMAVAWTISEAFIKFPNETMKLLEENQLEDFTYKKSLQKIIESYRIDEKTKDKIRKMKNVK